MRIRFETRLVVCVLSLGLSACVEAPERFDEGGESTGAAEDVGTISSAIDLDAPVVIRQVYGGGGNSGAIYTHDFIELFNRSNAPVSLAGWSLQYASATGTGALGANATQLTELPSIVLQPGQSFLVQEATQAAVGLPLPAPDVVDATPIAMSGTAGKVALVRSSSGLGCNGSSSPCSAAQLALIVDLVGYGSANFFEGAASTAAPANSTAVARASGGCTDTNQNGSDFSVMTPVARNTASPLAVCDPSDAGTDGGSDGGPDDGGSDSGTDSGTPDGGGDAGGGGELRIHEIQGASHLSPHAGAAVTNVPGVVTLVRSNGFYFQDPVPDGSDATSEALFVFTSSAPGVSAGDSVTVSGTVSEYRPGCSPTCSTTSSAYSNLTTTEITSPVVTVVSSGNALPPFTRIGPSGRMPPANVIDDDSAASVEDPSAVFDPAGDGIDFYESLEGMRIELVSPVASGPNTDFSSSNSREISVLPELGVGAGTRTSRGGIVIAANDFNPERVLLQGTLSPAVLPTVNVGDTFMGGVNGILDYDFGNYKLLVTSVGALTPGGLVKETHTLGAQGPGQLGIASFNVENLDPSDPASKFSELASLITNNLGSPDLLVLEEVQDNSGATNNGVVDAGTTLSMLVNAIVAAGGPTYSHRSVNPQDGQDGGEPGGNIRVVFLYRSDRGLAFIDRPGATATTANSVVNSGGVPQLAFSPGRIDPTNAAFGSSRKPLAAEFTFSGKRLFVIGNHWNSKGGDQPLFGRFQPPALTSETQRVQQATLVRGFVQQITAIDPNAAVIVAGDLNDFEFSAPVDLLKSAGLSTLIETLPPAERYSYVYSGNSQVLDHLMVSPSLMSTLVGFDVVHTNSEFSTRASDHDPAVARFNLAAPPSVPTGSLGHSGLLAVGLAAAAVLVLGRRRRLA
jgi:predicted extracellular nuclease